MSRALPRSTLVLLIASGCVFSTKPVDDGRPPEDRPPSSDDGRPHTDVDQDPSPTDSGEDEPEAPPVVPGVVEVEPGRVIAGTVDILVLTSDGVDLREVVSAAFFGTGGVEVLAGRPRGAGLHLLAVETPDDAEAGPQDLLLTLGDGTGVWVEDALVVE